MVQNKIYNNFLIDIFKTFLIILFGLSLVALTARAVNFLDLLVESGYSVNVYFKYSFLNIFGIAPKFIPLSFLLALTIFILKRTQDSEFIILWTSGLKKISVINLFVFSSIVTLVFYLIFSVFITPYTLNKSRLLLAKDSFNSLLPTIKTQQFSDSFKGFTFFVEKKINNEIEGIFLNDKTNNLKNFSSNISKNKESTITAKYGLIDKRNLILFDGQIISTKNNLKNEMIKFEQINIDLGKLSTTTIKKPKIQETSTLKLLNCFTNKNTSDGYVCDDDFKKELLPILNRRIISPFYIPVLSLICALLLIKSNRIFFNKILVFFYGFTVLLFTEITVRYTGLNHYAMTAYILMPFVLIGVLYTILVFNLSKENKNKS